jgi:peptide/nickel transport system permease protein
MTAQPLEAELVAGGSTDLRRRLRRVLRSPLTLLGTALVALMVAVALAGPLLAPYPQDATGAIHMQSMLLPPSATHLFGTDEVGRDIFSRVVLGSRISLLSGVVVVLSACSIGVVIGTIAGYFGGLVDLWLMRLTDVFLTIPALILALAIGAALGSGLVNTMVAISLVWWPGYCRLVRGEVIALRGKPFIEAAVAQGSPRLYVMWRHVLPNCLSPLIVKMSLDIGYAILTTAALGFLGIGAKPPTPEWGGMVADGRQYLPNWWWYSTFPGLAIFMTVFGFNLFGDGMRAVLDPRGRR